jgi:hypothetical protein
MTSLSTLFTSILAQTSGETQVAYLDARTRWSLFIEICTGNAKIKGGRSRDFPFSEQRTNNTELALRLSACNLNKKYLQGLSAHTQVSKLNFLIASMVFETANSLNAEPIASELYYSSALSKLVDIVFDDADSENSKLKQLMGISTLGRDTERKHYPSLHIQCAVQLAFLADIDISEQANSQDAKTFLIEHIKNKQIFHCMQSRSLDLMYLKTKKVQTYLNGCTKSYTQRGASYWCAHFIALVRDVIDKNTAFPSVLLTDCDSVSIRALSSSEDENAIREAIYEYFIDAKANHQLNEDFIKSYFPRLLPYFKKAKQEKAITCNILPDIELCIRKGVTLIDLLVERSSLGDWQVPLRTSENIMQFQRSYDVTHDIACDACPSEPAFDAEDMLTPTWYAKNRGDRYGFKSVFLSLIGMNMKKQIQQSLQESISQTLNRDIILPKSLKDLAKRSCSERSDLCLIKYDGDKIGQAFSNRCFTSRPELSVRVEATFRKALLKATAEIVEQHSLDFCPVELIYFGGDDLFVVVASCYANDFVKCFDHHMLATINEFGLTIRASFVGFHFSLPLNIGQSAVQKDDEHTILAIINQAMDSFKAQGKMTCQYPQYPNFKPFLVEVFTLSCTQGNLAATINLEAINASLSPFLQSVMAFASNAHGKIDHRRKYDDSDYIVHPISVMQKVQSTSDHTEEMLAAALLHDTVEDTDVCLSDIETSFGPEIAMMVDFLSDKSKPEDGNRATRKEIDRQHIAKAPASVKTVKLADLLDNSESILRFAPGFAEVFVKEVSLLLEVLGEGDRRLFEELQKTVTDFKGQ